MKGPLILLALAAAAAASVTTFIWTWLRDASGVSPTRLFGTDPKHINVRSADNVRLLSDDQLRALERMADEPNRD